MLIEAGHEADVALAKERLRAIPSWRALLGNAVLFDNYRLLYAMTQADDLGRQDSAQIR